MIRCLYVDSHGEGHEGDRQLIDVWREDPGGHLWIDCYDEPLADEITLLSALGCHSLAISDAQRQRHPPKLEAFDEHTFLLYRGFKQFEENLAVETIQLAFWISDSLLITRRNGHSHGVEALWQQRNRDALVVKPAHLAMRIVVASANGYLNGVLQFEQTLSELEESMLDNASDELMQQLVLFKSRLRQLKRVFSYHERIFAQLLAHPTAHVGLDEDVIHQVQDAYEKMERLHSLSQMYDEIAGDLLDGYLSITSHRLNNTMRILTVVTAIFVPISFLAGLYGMNFEVIPELKNPYGYFMLLAVMAAIAISLLAIFRRNKWI